MVVAQSPFNSILYSRVEDETEKLKDKYLQKPTDFYLNYINIKYLKNSNFLLNYTSGYEKLLLCYQPIVFLLICYITPT